jgi:hypothetical protein
MVNFWVVAFSEVAISVRRLMRECWRRYHWEGRPSRRGHDLSAQALSCFKEASNQLLTTMRGA